MKVVGEWMKVVGWLFKGRGVEEDWGEEERLEGFA